MRHGTAGRRVRSGRNNGPRRPANPRNQVFESNGPDVRVRGTAAQVFEKYLSLARDSASSGDRVLYESYMQHAEHYQRIHASYQEFAPRDDAPQPAFSSDSSEEAAEDESAQQDGAFTPYRRPSRSVENRMSRRDSDEEDLGLPQSILGVSQEGTSSRPPRSRETHTESREYVES